MEKRFLSLNDDNKIQPNMPVGYRILTWGLTIDIIGCTAFVWWLIYLVMMKDKPVDMFQAPIFFRMVIGYHILLLFWTIMGNVMQTSWRILGTSGLFGMALVIGSLFCNVVAVELAYLI
jgi:hypothetical protein